MNNKNYKVKDKKAFKEFKECILKALNNNTLYIQIEYTCMFGFKDKMLISIKDAFMNDGKRTLNIKNGIKAFYCDLNNAEAISDIIKSVKALEVCKNKNLIVFDTVEGLHKLKIELCRIKPSKY